MDNKTPALLPYILETLNRKPEMCDTYENLKNEIKKAFPLKNLNALDDALNVGQSLGILTLSDDLVSVPFNYGSSRLKATKKKSLTEDGSAPEEYFGVQPRRTYTVPPNLFSQARRRGSRRHRSRRRSRSRRRRSRRR